MTAAKPLTAADLEKFEQLADADLAAASVEPKFTDNHYPVTVKRLVAWVRELENEPTCACIDLVMQVQKHGHALESSCEIHQWDLVNQVCPKESKS